MERQVVKYNVRLQAWFRRDGREWIVWCPGIDIMTQARTRKGALESLLEAVELWFESCIERGVLNAALNELGYDRLPPDEETPEGVDFVSVVRRPAPQPPATETGMSFSLGQRGRLH